MPAPDRFLIEAPAAVAEISKVPLPRIDPVVSVPLPSCNMPAVMVVPPLQVLVPERVSVPVPTFSSAPCPVVQPHGLLSAMTPLTSVDRLLLPTFSVLPPPI